MTGLEKVTVDKAYFDALLRRADFHTSAQIYGRPEPVNVSISKVEYDSLLRISREYEMLKSALYQGGITSETLELLISSGKGAERKDSGSIPNAWADDYGNDYHDRHTSQPAISLPHREMPWRQTTGSVPAFNLAPGSGPFSNGHMSGNLRVPSFARQVSFEATLSSVPDETGLDDNDSIGEDGNHAPGPYPPQEKRTLYFSGFSDRTTYRDLLSVIKGGKLLSVNLRPERSATVTFLEGAAEFLAWAKRNDIYLHSKRIEVKWADRQYRLNGHIANKITNGATRNLIVRNAFANGLSDTQIKSDMEHIHNLHIIDVVFRNGDAYVTSNSVHNALFARTCMMSRTSYKGCKVEFFRDECDIPLPVPAYKSRAPAPAPVKTKAPLANRFDMLKIDGDHSSDEENKTPIEGASDEDGTRDMSSNMGVSLNFLDSEST